MPEDKLVRENVIEVQRFKSKCCELLSAVTTWGLYTGTVTYSWKKSFATRDLFQLELESEQDQGSCQNYSGHKF